MLKIPISQKTFSASLTQDKRNIHSSWLLALGAVCPDHSRRRCGGGAGGAVQPRPPHWPLTLHNVGGNFLCHDPSPTLSRWSLDQTLQPTTLQTMLPQLWCPVPTCFLSYDSSIDVGMVMRTKPSRPVHWCFCWGCVRFIHKRFMSESRKLLSHLSICLSDVLCTITISYNS